MTLETTTHSLLVLDEVAPLRSYIQQSRHEGKVIGLVPTMGALHAGHLSLIEAARREVDELIVTIFVNPTQFGPQEDYQEYPRPFEKDLAACRNAGVDVVFHPSVELLYPEGFCTFVEVEGLSKLWEGKFRPTHFRGVTTIVMKLLQLVQPDIAYFGRKDYQQQLLIRRMCHDLNVPVEIRTCPTVREHDGLALSSRNVYLDKNQRTSALSLSNCLKLAQTMIESGETDLAKVRQAMLKCLTESGDVVPDYVTIAHAETLEELDVPQSDMIALVAARVGTTRLIDNLPISRQ
ncbi:MAG: pantoate--beta-alanine ligase [Planctomycetaceae bacterium]